MALKMKHVGLFLSILAAASAAHAAEMGSVTLRMTEDAKVKNVIAIDRESGKKFVGELDVDTDEYVIRSLPLDAAYDCIVDFANGSRLEGVNLNVPASEYEEEQPLVQEDIEMITEKVLRSNKFEEQIDILAIQGNIQHAAVVLNKLRTKPFYNSKPGEIVWRAELWRFERPEETWVKTQDKLFTVLYRERLQQKAYDKKAITFDPRLGGLTPTAETPRIEIGPVEPPDASPGVRLRGAAPGPDVVGADADRIIEASAEPKP